MNFLENNCVDVLNKLVKNEGVIGIKTSFEDEGASFNEIVKLKQFCSQAGTDLIIKIGGPEAIRDIRESNIIGANGIVAPMIESRFGLQKFIKSISNNVLEENRSRLHLNINIETKTSIENIDDIFKDESIKYLDGITVGRVDLVSSMNKEKNFVDSEEVLQATKKVFTLAKQNNLKACLGGAISINSYKFIENLYSEGLLDKFETRYVIYDTKVSLKNFSKALSEGQIFEQNWLLSKKQYYSQLAEQDTKRIQMIQERINRSLE